MAPDPWHPVPAQSCPPVAGPSASAHGQRQLGDSLRLTAYGDPVAGAKNVRAHHSAAVDQRLVGSRAGWEKAPLAVGAAFNHALPVVPEFGIRAELPHQHLAELSSHAEAQRLAVRG